MDIGRPCQVLRCTRGANTVFAVNESGGGVIETVVCDPHDEELRSTTGWFFDDELRRIRMGEDAPAQPTRYQVTRAQDDAEVFTLSYQHGAGEEQDIELFLTREVRHGLIRALRGLVDERDQ